MNRRHFLLDVASAAVGGSLLAACSTRATASRTAASRDGIGLQLYTVRDLLQKDFDGTLAEVARIGYRKVEFAGYFGRTPAQVRAVLDRVGLAAPSAHVGVTQLRQDLAAQIASAKAIGHEYLTAPSYPIARTATLADFQRMAADLTAWGKACRDAGLRFAFHNHSVEFQQVGGRPGFEVLLAETDPKLVEFELDLYWARFAGADPIDLFERHPGRFTMWHVKDMRDAANTKTMVPVGAGEIDFRAMFARAGRSGLRHFFVEHDNAAQTGGSLASIQASHAHLQRILP